MAKIISTIGLNNLGPENRNFNIEIHTNGKVTTGNGCTHGEANYLAKAITRRYRPNNHDRNYINRNLSEGRSKLSPKQFYQRVAEMRAAIIFMRALERVYAAPKKAKKTTKKRR